MEFRLLGPLEVSDGDRGIPLGGPKQRTVLAHLLLGANTLVTVERLIDALWGDDPPASARNTLQTYIKHLRKLVGAERIEHLSSGYRFAVGAHELDMLRFEALVDEARQLATSDIPGAVSRLREALGLWRGPALDDLSEQPSLRPEIARLEEMRTAAIEERMAADLALGRHRDLIPELEAMLARQPYRERSWGHLMVALYRAGRQGDALASFLRARDVLRDDLGIDPSPELTHLQEQILQHDPGLETEGETLRGYRLLEQLGEGAFGVVHRAYQPDVGREVAVKVIHPRLANHPEFIRRFTAEAQLVARLEHPHIVPLYDYWRDPNGAYLVMRYLRGGSLREAIADGPLDLQRAVGVTDQIARALAAAHRQGVVHRDVQPANVLFDEDGNAYLSDFGIAKDLATAEVRAEGGAPVEFAYYMSPEEARGDEPTQRADIYSLGLVFYECLAGRHAFGDTPSDGLERRRTHEFIPLLSSVRPDLPAPLDLVVAKAVAEEPSLRFPDTLAFVAALRAALGPSAAVAGVEGAEVRNPYKGLRPFLEADAADFFGREGSIDDLLARMKDASDEARFLAVVGPSGCGKSSLVRAGLLPALRRGGLPGSESWFSVDMHPGDQPFDELAAGLARLSVDPPADLSERLACDRDGLRRAADEILPPSDTELLLVIDQFEEVFTLVSDEDTRSRFLGSVVAAATDPGSRVRVVATLRADFYDRPLLYKGFGDLLASRTCAVTPLSASEIEAAVSGPAGSVGIGTGPGLLGEVVADVAGRPGALPLLQFALTELFEGRADSTLTLDMYRALGGVPGALARGAEAIFDGLTPDAKDATRQLFLRLVELGEEGSQDTRRRALRSELTSLGVDRGAMETAIDTFGSRRLLAFDRDPDSRAPTVEVAHEALLTEWGRLRGWIESAREDIRVGRRLAVGAAEWERGGRDPSFLVRGANLQRTAVWSSTTGLGLARPEREFLDASVELADIEREEEEDRRTHELQIERRSGRRLRALVALLSVAALVAAILTIVATNRGTEAERQATIASARELVAASAQFLDTDSDRSILLAMEAVERTRSVDGSVLPEAEEALHRAVAASRAVMTVPGIGGVLSWSPTGVFVTAGAKGTGKIDIRDDSSGESVLTFRAHDGEVTDVAFSPDGSMLATTGTDGRLKVWDPVAGDFLWSVSGNGEAENLSFSDDGSRVAASWPSENVVRIANPHTGKVVRKLQSPGAMTALSPDGDRIALAGAALVLIDLESRQRLELAHPYWGVWGVSWSPNGDYITAHIHARIWLFDARSGTLLEKLLGGRPAGEVAWSPDSRRLVAPAPSDGTAIVWSIQEGGAPEEISTLLGGEMNEPIAGLAFSHDGTAVMASGDRTTVKIWKLEPRNFQWASFPARGIYWSDVEYMPDGQRVATNAYGKGGFVKIWDVASGRLVRRLGHDENQDHRYKETSFDVSPDGELVAIISGTEMRVWKVANGEEVLPMRRDGVISAGWSPDGDLVVAASADGVARIIDRSGGVVQTLSTGWDERMHDARFSPDGRLVATTKNGEETLVWDWDRGEVISRIPDDGPWEIAFDRMGSRIVSANALWDTETGEQVMALPHDPNAGRVVFSPDGSRFARASFGGGVGVFDARSGEELFRLDDGCAIAGVDFSPDGSRLVTVGGCYTMKIWAADIDDLLHLARQRVTRALTEEECRLYLHVDRCPA